MLNRRRSEISNLYECPCCGFAVFQGIDRCEICEICYWGDDGSDDAIPPEDPLNNLSLEEVRLNFIRHGASELRRKDVVRSPSSADYQLREFEIEDGVAIEKKKT
ncbi:hypothetical protein AAKU61_002312 [Undibacterium sp. GrIS 1.2]|uniref:CPCC family cysteine-rich protein n=1 Tax=Undibacterium sp. GrIS 1.2 TaxID=3143933 RepID=UPI003390D7C5